MKYIKTIYFGDFLKLVNFLPKRYYKITPELRKNKKSTKTTNLPTKFPTTS